MLRSVNRIPANKIARFSKCRQWLQTNTSNEVFFLILIFLIEFVTKFNDKTFFQFSINVMI